MSYTYFARFYDSLTGNVDYRERCNYISSIMNDFGVSDGIVLDLACGTGSMSVALAEKGYDVIGADMSSEMLSIAREKAVEAGQQILFLCQPMEELDLFGTIRGCVCCLDSLNHLINCDDFEKAIENVSLFMEKGGVFVFDVNTPYKHEFVLGDNSFVYENDDVFAIWQNQYEKETGIVDISLDFFEQRGDGSYERSSEDFSERAYSVDYITEVLLKNDFEILGVYDDMSREKFKENSERIYFAARKKNGQTC